jgi:prepilin-type processing-associated H-X9-DG protein
MCPDQPPDMNTLGTTVEHYACHPLLMPQMTEATETLSFDQAYPVLFGYYVPPYRLTHIAHSADIAMIFESSIYPINGPLNQNPNLGGGYTVYDFVPVEAEADSYGIDYGTAMTDNYTYGSTYGANNIKVTVNGNDPINMDAQGGAAYVNTDTQGNQQNIRFAHMSNTKTNALMCDGHVQTFTFNPANIVPTAANPATNCTDFLKKNIYVTWPQPY